MTLAPSAAPTWRRRVDSIGCTRAMSSDRQVSLTWPSASGRNAWLSSRGHRRVSGGGGVVRDVDPARELPLAASLTSRSFRQSPCPFATYESEDWYRRRVRDPVIPYPRQTRRLRTLTPNARFLPRWRDSRPIGRGSDAGPRPRAQARGAGVHTSEGGPCLWGTPGNSAADLSDLTGVDGHPGTPIDRLGLITPDLAGCTHRRAFRWWPRSRQLECGVDVRSVCGRGRRRHHRPGGIVPAWTKAEAPIMSVPAHGRWS